DDAERGHYAVVLAGIYRIRAVRPRRAAPLHHANALGADRAVRIVRPRLDRPLLAPLHPAAAGRRAARRHRTLPARRQVGLVRRIRLERHAQATEDAQVGADGILPCARLRDARGLHQDRDPARAAVRSAVRADVAIAAARRAMKILYTDVLVIGGGLAGLRVAIGARRRGHAVTIL